MLKIKDNVDLEELKKYGFIVKILPTFESVNYANLIWCNTKTRKIIIDNFVGDEIIDKLYDLIKAGFVEKVDDNNGK